MKHKAQYPMIKLQKNKNNLENKSVLNRDNL
jgi:hypothetical protein